jgi:hypothetical protein
MNELHADWITHRLPTAADADDDGDVRLPEVPKALPGDYSENIWQHWSLVVPGQPWWSEKAATNPTPASAPARKVVQIEAAPESKNCYSCLYALYDDNSIYEIAFRPGMPDQWRQLPPIPQPGDQ